MKRLVIFLSAIIIAHVEASVPFQVSIQLKNSGSDASQYHLCSGIIIGEKHILTTVNCLHYPIMNTNLNIPLMASDITVAAGSANGTIYRTVDSIILHSKFNKTTNANDLGVLKLDNSLPLTSYKEIQWINVATIKDKFGSDQSCFSTTFNITQLNSSPYVISKNPSNLQHSVCENTNDTTSIRPLDLCLEYTLSDKMNCNATSSSMNFLKERGTAYVCNNKLIGLLADINPPKSIEKCFLNQQTTGFYANVSSYTEWLLEVTELSQFDTSKPQNPSIPSWTESPLFPSQSTSKPNGTTGNVCNFIVLFASLMYLIMF